MYGETQFNLSTPVHECRFMVAVHVMRITKFLYMALLSYGLICSLQVKKQGLGFHVLYSSFARPKRDTWTAYCSTVLSRAPGCIQHLGTLLKLQPHGSSVPLGH